MATINSRKTANNNFNNDNSPSTSICFKNSKETASTTAIQQQHQFVAVGKDLVNGGIATTSEGCQAIPSTSASAPAYSNTSASALQNQQRAQHFYRYWPHQQWPQYSPYFASNGYPSSESNYYAYSSYPALSYWPTNNWGWPVKNWANYQQQNQQKQQPQPSTTNSVNSSSKDSPVTTNIQSTLQNSQSLDSSPSTSKTPDEANNASSYAWYNYHQQQNAVRLKLYQRHQLAARYLSGASNSGF